MIVDDHPIMRETLDAILRREDNITITCIAENGIEAVEMMKMNPNKIDVVLMDLEMPYMDGIQATKIISESCPSIRTLILTTHDDLDLLSRAMEVGAMGFMVKPVGKYQLLEAISTVAAGNYYLGYKASLSKTL